MAQTAGTRLGRAYRLALGRALGALTRPARAPTRGAAQRAACTAFALAAVLVTAMAQAQTPPRPRPDFGTTNPTGGDSIAPNPQRKPQPRPAAPAEIPPPQMAAPQLGPVSKLPLPRYASLKAAEANARRGPDLSHRIDWVFTAKGMPLRIVAEYENWRKVEDLEGFGGWVHFTLLSGVRSIIITQEMAPFYQLPDPNSPVVFHAEKGVLARVLECQFDWCRINAEGARGWAPKTAFWGVDPQEVLK